MKFNYIYIGANGFPYGMATIQRQLLIAKGLNNENSKCIILCRYGVNNKNKKIKRNGEFENIEYKYASALTYRHNNFIIRNLNKILSLIIEPFIIYKAKNRNEKNILLSVRPTFINCLFYRLISFLLGFKYIIDINELHSFKKSVSFTKKINNYLFDNYCIYFCDSIIVISNFIKNFYETKKRRIPIIKLPIVCDIDKIDEIEPIKLNNKYILYCASAEYFETAIFVIDSFKTVKDKIYLKMILGSSPKKIKRINDYISSCSLSSKIEIKSNLEYDELISYYKSADGLIIPLPESKDNLARFPHKIGEYAASRKPIITNNWGEVINYFDHNSALIAKHFEINDYSILMNRIIEGNINPEIIDNAYNIAKSEFDIKIIFDKFKQI